MDPTLFAFALGLGSAVTLAGANTLVKAAKDILGGRTVMTVTGSILMLPAVFFVPLPVGRDLGVPRLLPAGALALPDGAGARAVARRPVDGLPGDARNGAAADGDLRRRSVLGEHLSPLAIAGLIIASLATIVFALPEKDFGGSRARAQFGDPVGAGDRAQALRSTTSSTRRACARRSRRRGTQWSFIVWLFVLDWIGISTIMLVTRGPKEFAASARARAEARHRGGRVLARSPSRWRSTDFHVAPVAYISAMRETAVVFAAIMGWWFLREGFGARRTFAAVVLAGGLCLLQFG